MTDRLVYSTDVGRIEEPKAQRPIERGDGIVRIQRQTSGRKGKGVCVITGLELDQAALTQLAAALKKSCGTGGSVKEQTIEIQGDFRDRLKSLLEERGYHVKFSGG